MKREHIDSAECWCEPYLYYTSKETGSGVWVHRQANLHFRMMDQPSPETLSEAVRLADEEQDPA